MIVTTEFERANFDIQIAFDSAGKISGLFIRPSQSGISYTPPPYSHGELFSEEELSVGSGALTLPATLTRPKGSGRFPTVVLVHGSGPSDRDETVGANKPFRDLAEGLASRGIAVLRYEKRTKAHPEAFASGNFTVKEETVDDAVTALGLLRRTPGIDSRRIWVLGHSLGAMLIPRIGVMDPDVAGFVVMAGPALPLEDLLLAQTAYLVGLRGSTSADETKKLREQIARSRALTYPWRRRHRSCPTDFRLLTGWTYAGTTLP